MYSSSWLKHITPNCVHHELMPHAQAARMSHIYVYFEYIYVRVNNTWYLVKKLIHSSTPKSSRS